MTRIRRSIAGRTVPRSLWLATTFSSALGVVACGSSSSSDGGVGGASSGSGAPGGGALAGGSALAGGGASANAGSPSGDGGKPSGAGSTSTAGGSTAGGGSAQAGAGAAVSGAGSAQAGASSGGGSAQAGAPSVAGEPPSCAPGGPGMNSCGPDGKESCCTSLPVAAGTFSRTYANTGSGATGKGDPATISAFRLDKYEMTVGRLRQFVNYLAAGGALPAAGSGKHTHLNAGKGLADSGKSGSFEPGWDSGWNSNLPTGANAVATWTKNLACSTYGTWSATAGNNETLPITCLDWYEAHAFCIWDGGFLPSQAEWEYAAAGGDEQRMYPWGSTDPGTDSKYAMYDCYYPTGKPGNCTSLANIAKVGTASMGGGKWGQLDLSGSVWEWDLDVYIAKPDNPCTDCAHLTGGTDRVLPGGGFHTGLMPFMLSSSRTSLNYATTYRGDYGVGVRCARTP